MNKEIIYTNIISLLGFIEVSIKDEKTFNFIRKRLLDIANDVKRLENGK